MTFTKRQMTLQKELSSLMRSGHIERVQVTGNLARGLKTSVTALKQAFPEDWYQWDDDDQLWVEPRS